MFSMIVVSVISSFSCAGDSPDSPERHFDLLHEVPLHELLARQIHADCQRQGWAELGLPGCHLAAGFAQCPDADRHNQAGLLGRRDEISRQDQSAIGVLPAQEALEAIQAAARELDDRLIVQLELAPVDGVAQIGLQLETHQRPLPHAGVEQFRAGLPEGLGPVHRRVGVAQDGLGRIVAVHARHDADAGGREDLMAGDVERRGQFPMDPLGHGAGVARPG